jgi:hypothetical protein
VAIILSGTGSDGTNGIRSIKDRNGLIIAQAPESAKFDGMPRSAIATGFADLILNPDSIAREMAHISRSIADAGRRLQLSDGDLMSQVFFILKKVTNINYSYYKQTTVLRRIERRIVVTHNRNLQEYVNYMSNNPEEQKRLIDVTWDVATDAVYKANIVIVAADKPGIMVDIMMAISENKININNISSHSDKNKMATIHLGLDITNIGQLETIMSRIKRIQGIYSVERLTTGSVVAEGGKGKKR